MNSQALSPAGILAVCLAGLTLTSVLHAQDRKNNPTSKFYVADLNGDALIDTGKTVDELVKKSVYNAEGTTIETKPKSNYAMVYSNGTGAYFDPDTKLDIKAFDQEPFRPNRDDMDIEPSISQTQAYLQRGTVGLCTSKMVAGSSMVYNTPQGSINVRGRKVVLEVSDKSTIVSMVEGDSTIQAGEMDAGGTTLHEGQQAIITRGAPGQPPTVVVQPIPSSQRSQIDDRVTAACVARRTVYFQAVGKTGLAVANSAGSTGTAAAATSVGGGSVFLNNAANSNIGTSAATAATVVVAVQVAPTTLPNDSTISPAFLH
jgi:hypothetical protein